MQEKPFTSQNRKKLFPLSPIGPVIPKVLLLLIPSAFFLLFFAYLVHEHTTGEIVFFWQQNTVSRIIHESGFAYQAPLGRIWMSAHQRPSPAKVLEDGIELGPSNAVHDEIRKMGRGRFSFWYDTLYFSTSDNSDPRTNGREYEIRWPTPVNRTLASLLYLLTFLTIFATGVFTAILVKKPLDCLRRGDGVWRMLFFSLSCFGLTILAYYLFMLFHRPVPTLAYSENLLIWLVSFLLAGGIGFYFAYLWASPQKIRLQTGIQAAAAWGIVSFFLLRAGILNSLSEYLSKAGILAGMVFLGILFFFVYQKGRTIFPLASSETWKKRKFLLAFLLIILATPGLIKPLVQYWDISGYMDSHMYDKNAHDIATGDIPQGNSLVMPLYQYGMAALYYVFGHFFYVQQIANVLAAFFSIVFLCLAGWNLFRNLWAVFGIGVLSAFTTQLHAFIYLTQIENWYIPLICLILFAWSAYWRQPILLHLIFLGGATGLAFNCRAQGVFFFAFLCLTPFFIIAMPIQKRILHMLGLVCVLAAMLLPWSIRNYVYEGRFSPKSDQAIIITINDPRTGFYGLRHDLFYNRDLGKYENKGLMSGFNEIYKEYEQKFADKEERNKAIQEDAIRNTLRDPLWTMKAVFWRSLSMYGLLPPGIFDPEGPKPTDWRVHWKGYVYNGFPSLFFIAFSVVGLLVRTGRTTVFLFLALVSNVAVTIFAPAVESRLSFPLFPFHMLLGMCIFFAPHSPDARQENSSPVQFFFRGRRIFSFLMILFSIAVFFLLCHLSVGRANLYRPLMERAVVIQRDIRVNPDLPSLNAYYQWLRDRKGQTPVFKNGEKVRLKCGVTNYMLPPKTGSAVYYLPSFAWDPSRETFYYAHPLEGGYVGMTYFGGSFNGPIRENDIVEIEGTILLHQTNTTLSSLDYWMRAEKVVLVKKMSPRS
jgi:hypothetical protein